MLAVPFGSTDLGLPGTISTHDIDSLLPATTGTEADQPPIRRPAWSLIVPLKGQLRFATAIGISHKDLESSERTGKSQFITLGRPGRINIV